MTQCSRSRKEEGESSQLGKKKRTGQAVLQFAAVTDGLASEGNKETVLPSTWNDPRLLFDDHKDRSEWNMVTMEDLQQAVGKQLCRILDYLVKTMSEGPALQTVPRGTSLPIGSERGCL